MAEFKSTQVTNMDASPAVKVPAQDLGGRKRDGFFDFTVPVGNAAVSDTVQLIKIPAGARIKKGWIAAEAMSTGAGAASIQLGDGTTAAKYLGTTDIDAAAVADFAHTIALNYGEVLTAELILTATVITEAWAAGQVLKGHIDFTMD